MPKGLYEFAKKKLNMGLTPPPTTPLDNVRMTAELVLRDGWCSHVDEFSENHVAIFRNVQFFFANS